MKIERFYQDYEYLVDEAEAAFTRIAHEHPSCVTCGLHCSDCCSAVFGLFLLEAVYLREQFEHLKEGVKKEVLDRCTRADEDLKKLQRMLREFKDDPRMRHYTLARERIRCPLLDDRDECVLYYRRPITCRVYGIPTRIQGKIRACSKTGFKPDEKYPLFDLDELYKKLFILSGELLEKAGQKDADKAALLLSVSKVLQTSVEDLIHESPEESDGDKGRGPQDVDESG